MFFVNPFVFNAGTSLINELSNLGLLTNLKVCLDAGDPNSYPGSGQMWSDLSGNGTHFYLGSGSGTDGADPTYTPAGNGGTYREYFSYDGGDYFTKSTANGTFFNSIHKDGAAYTVLLVAYGTNLLTTNSYFLGDGFVGGSPGWTMGSDTGLKPSFTVYRADGSQALKKQSTNALTDNSWNLMAVAYDEASGTGRFQISGNQDTFSGSTYSTPSAADAGTQFQIGALGNNAGPEGSGHRVAAFAMWDRALTGAELSAIYGHLKSRFSLP